jgi:hypothetical protein
VTPLPPLCAFMTRCRVTFTSGVLILKCITFTQILHQEVNTYPFLLYWSFQGAKNDPHFEGIIMAELLEGLKTVGLK